MLRLVLLALYLATGGWDPSGLEVLTPSIEGLHGNLDPDGLTTQAEPPGDPHGNLDPNG
jgi:hypothetical protein